MVTGTFVLMLSPEEIVTEPVDEPGCSLLTSTETRTEPGVVPEPETESQFPLLEAEAVKERAVGLLEIETLWATGRLGEPC
jgi:hypothetical protein